MINIAVVSDKKHRKYGVALVNSISQIDKSTASLYTPKKFLDNEHSITGRNHVIFIGKNKISEPYIDLIKIKYNKYWTIWGWSGTKACVYVDKVVLQEKEISKELNVITKEVSKYAQHKGAKAGSILGGLIASNFVSAVIPIIGGIGGFGSIIGIARRRAVARRLQYRLGIATFLKDGFDEYIGKSKSE